MNDHRRLSLKKAKITQQLAVEKQPQTPAPNKKHEAQKSSNTTIHI